MHINFRGETINVTEAKLVALLEECLEVVYDLNMNADKSGPGPDRRRDSFILALNSVIGGSHVGTKFLTREREVIDFKSVAKIIKKHYGLSHTPSDLEVEVELRMLARKIKRGELSVYSEGLAAELKLI